MANENEEKVTEKRERVAELRGEIMERAAQHSRELTERRNVANEERLDREIAQLELELTRMDQAEAFARGEKPEPPPEVEDMTKAELQQLPEYNSIEGRAEMKKDELVEAIVEARKEGV